MRHPFHLSLESVLEEPLPFEFEMPIPVAQIDREPLLEISPVRLAGTVSRIERGHALEARVSWSGRLECSRCLAPYPFEAQESFTIVLSPRRPALEGEVALERTDLDVSFYDDPTISVVPIAEERVQMAIPMKPLCREDCRGLCPRCGQDKNVGTCTCTLEETDPRWDALRTLRR
jgi:uncharacterized protein